MKLIENPSSSNPPKRLEIEPLSEYNENKMKNCYMMCLGNRNNIKYQVAI